MIESFVVPCQADGAEYDGKPDAGSGCESENEMSAQLAVEGGEGGR